MDMMPRNGFPHGMDCTYISFSWDPIFIPSGSEKTWAEMAIDKQKETSLRKMALEKLYDGP